LETAFLCFVMRLLMLMPLTSESYICNYPQPPVPLICFHHFHAASSLLFCFASVK
jgi:hypothetical protein